MLFNSVDFAVFLPIVFIIYWLLNAHIKQQNLFIAIASYLFYGWWDSRFLLLIFFSTTTDFIIGLCLGRENRWPYRKILLWISILVNIGILGFFKYYNFFLETLIDSFTLFGSKISANSLNIILPVGISFYTFQTLSYTIDVYKKRLEPCSNFIAFTAFVSFFPQLVAGPIERASNLLPQFYAKRIFNYDNAIQGLRQILWGLFKKIVIADNCAEYANQIFNNSTSYHGAVLFLGAFFFAFQIYGDFSGYSDIAIGTSRLFGFKLMQNFAFPYFSRDIGEFWRRWHISLSTWFRDYLYIPLGGSRGSMFIKIRNILIIFIVSGFWHGANWTFIVWGAINAIYFLPLMLAHKNRHNLDVVAENTLFPSPKEFFQMCSTFLLTLIAWIFFRSDDLSHSYSYIHNLIYGLFEGKYYLQALAFLYQNVGLLFLLILFLFVITEWMGRRNEYGLAPISLIPNRATRWTLYYIILFLLFTMKGQEQDFIYFQF